MPFGIPTEYFHGGFGLPEVEECVINYDNTDGEAEKDDYDPYTGKYAFCPPMTDEEFTKAYKDYMDEYRTDDDVSDEEYEAAAQEAHDELVRSLVEAGGEIRELKAMLREAKDALFYMLVLHDSSHGRNMREAVQILYHLQSDNCWNVRKAREALKKISEYCEQEDTE